MSNRSKTATTSAFECTLSVMALRALVSSISGAVQRSSTIPILSHIKLACGDQTVTATGCDLERTISKTVSVSGMMPPRGALCLPGSALGDIAARLDGDADVTLSGDRDNARVTITSGRSRFQLPYLDADDFPDLGREDLGGKAAAVASGEAQFEVVGTDLARMLSVVGCAVGTEETRHYLTGVHMHVTKDAFHAVATNGHILSHMKGRVMPGAQGMPPIIIPSATVGVLIKQLTHKDMAGAMAELHVTPQRITVSVGEWRLTSKLIDGQFPEYGRVIPTGQGSTQITCEPKEMLAAVSRCAIVAKAGQASGPVRIEVKKGALTLDAARAETGTAHEEVHADAQGKDISIGCMPAYLAKAYELASGTDDAVLHIFDPSAPMRLDIPSSSITFVVMPMRV